MKKAEIHFHSHGQSGNVYWIMGAVRAQMQEERRITEWNDLRDQITSSGSYEEALRLIREHVNLIDDDGMY